MGSTNTGGASEPSEPTYSIVVDNASLFTVLPRIDASGTLHLSLSRDATGVAIFQISKTQAGIVYSPEVFVLKIVPSDKDSGLVLLRTEVIDNRFVPVFKTDSGELAVIGAAEWLNPILSLDVDGDGKVIPADALVIINVLNNPTITQADGRFKPTASLNSRQFVFVDVDGDGKLVPLDAILVINFLNSQTGSGEPIMPPLFKTTREDDSIQFDSALETDVVDQALEELSLS